MSKGFLADIEGVIYRYTCYRWVSNKWKTAGLLVLSQARLFLRILFSPKENVIYYINSIIPFGAAWACRLSRKKFIYHIHENMQQNKPGYGLYRWTYRHCNKKSIFVSKYLSTTALNCRDGVVVYNGLSFRFVDQAKQFLSINRSKRQNIIMVSSLRRFKGVFEFVELAKKMPQYMFELVLSASENDVFTFKSENGIPENLTVHSVQDNLHPFYERAKLLLQLTNPELWVETFGLSILEAMVYGIPAIVPYIGGPTELIEDGINGFHVDPKNFKEVSSKIENLMEDDVTYKLFSNNALKKSKEFSEERLISEIEDYIMK